MDNVESMCHTSIVTRHGESGIDRITTTTTTTTTETASLLEQVIAKIATTMRVESRKMKTI